jgi:murein DD-endopeptidase MepM/ murein hydrolase activator NlpD
MTTKKPLPSFLVILLITFFIAPSYNKPLAIEAATREELEASKADLTAKITALDKEIKEFSKKINETQGEAKTLKKALDSLIARRDILLKEIQKTNLQIRDTEGKLQDTLGDIASTTNTLDRTKAGLAETFRTMLHSNNNTIPIVRILSPSYRISDMFDDIKKSEDISHEINKKIEDLHSLKNVLSFKRDRYEDNKKALENLNSTLNDQQALIEQTKKETANLLTQTKNKEAEYQRLVSERKKKKTELESEVLDVESKIKTIVDASKIPKYGKGILAFPADKVVITQYFGNTPFASKNPQVYNGSGHNGIDLGLPVGTPLYSAAAGVVLGTGDTDASCSGVSYGKWVLIRHDNGLTTLYAHLSVIQTSKGKQVAAREKIGLSGNTGYSTGPHLHFTVYASEAVEITTYRSKVCGTNMTMPIAPRSGYLNPLSYL